MRLLAIQLAGELRRLFSRKRTYIGFGAFLAIESLIIFLLQRSHVQRSIRAMVERSGYPADEYLSGLTLAFGVLVWTAFLLGTLYIALVSGEAVSKEVEEGTMRMLLCRPASRFRVLLVKAAASLIYTAILIVFIAASALAIGVAFRGAGGLAAVAPGVFALYDWWPGLGRYLLAVPFVTLGMFTIAAVGFFFSCLNMKPAAAAILTISVFFADSIIKNIPYFEDVRDWFLTTRLAAWTRLFEPHIPWASLLENYSWLLAADFTLFVLAWVVFERRDFKS